MAGKKGGEPYIPQPPERKRLTNVDVGEKNYKSSGPHRRRKQGGKGSPFNERGVGGGGGGGGFVGGGGGGGGVLFSDPSYRGGKEESRLISSTRL